ncbi:MAG: phosphoribosylaminoimidazolesuccinocarboxamide synthase [Ignavibacteria bacterium]|nr:phosphoribosylaminoimidazolesuccinocarboxamide synthase [Ignavibacteria bacterium]
MTEFLYEGKAKKIFKTDNPEEYLVYFKDDATAFNAQKKGTVLEKGIINNKLSNYFFKIIESRGIPTHFVREISDRESIVKKVKIIPVEVIVRNKVAGSMAKRMGIDEGFILKYPTIEFSYKNDELGDPLMADSYVVALGLCSDDDFNTIKKYSMQINEILKEEMLKAEIILIDFKLEFGKTSDDTIILADEISPDTCRLWDAKTNEKLDKDRFRRDLGNVEGAYKEVLKRFLQ